VVEACVKALFHYISGTTDEDHKQPQDNWSPGRPSKPESCIYEAGLFQGVINFSSVMNSLCMY
jgi:hypothetical protein